MTDKKSFIIFNSDEFILEDLDNEQFREFWKIIFNFNRTGEIPEIDDKLLKMAVKMKVSEMKRTNEKYLETCKRRKEAANKRWAKQNSTSDCEEDANSCNCIQNNTNYTDNYNYNVSENVTESVIESENGSGSDIGKMKNVIDYDGDGEKDIDKISANAEFRTSVYNKQEKNSHFQAESIIAMYNSICTNLPSVQRTTKERLIAVENLINKGYAQTDFQNAFEKSQKSDFLRHGKDGNWQATFDWIIQEKNLIKILEGNYDNKNTKNSHNKAKIEETDHELDKYRALINQF